MLALENPPTITQLKEIAKDNYVKVTVAIGLEDIIHSNYENFLNDLSISAAGSELLEDISYTVIGFFNNTLIIEVTGDITSILENYDPVLGN